MRSGYGNRMPPQGSLSLPSPPVTPGFLLKTMGKRCRPVRLWTLSLGGQIAMGLSMGLVTLLTLRHTRIVAISSPHPFPS